MTLQSAWFGVYFDQEKNISDVAAIMSKGGCGIAPQKVEPAQFRFINIWCQSQEYRAATSLHIIDRPVVTSVSRFQGSLS